MDIHEAVLKLSLSSILTKVIQLVAIAVFTNMLGAAVMGSFFLFQSLIGMIGVPANLGIGRATEKQLSASSPTGETISTSVLLKGCLIAPWVAALLIFDSQISSYVGFEDIVFVLILALFVREYKKLSVRILAGQLAIQKVAILRLFARMSWLGAGYLLIQGGWGIFSVIYGLILADLIILFGSVVRMDLAISKPSLERGKEMVSFGKYIFIGSTGGIIYSWMDVSMLRIFGVSTDLIAAYEIAWRVAGVTMLVTSAIKDSLFAKISEWYSRNEIKSIEDALETWVQPGLLLTIPAFAGAIIMGDTVLGVIFGTSFMAGYSVLIIFLSEKILRSIKMTYNPSLYAIDKSRLAYRGNIAAIVTNILLNVLLIPFFGIIGAAIATTSGAFISTVINIYYLRQYVSIRLPYRRIVWSAIAATVMVLVVWLIKPYTPHGWIRLIAGIGLGVVIYFVLLFSNTGIRRDAWSEFG